MDNQQFQKKYEQYISGADSRKQITLGLDFLYRNIHEDQSGIRAILHSLLKESRKNHYAEEIAYGLILYGILAAQDSEYTFGENYVRNGLTILEHDCDDTALEIKGYKALGYIFTLQCSFLSAEIAYRKALKKAEQIHQAVEETMILISLTEVYLEMKEYQKALETAKNSYSHSTNGGEIPSKCMSALLIGKIYDKQKNYPEAEKYLQEAKTLIENHSESVLLPSVISELIHHYLQKGKPRSALSLAKENRDTIENNSDRLACLRIQLYQASSCLALGMLEEGETLLLELIEKAEDINEQDILLETQKKLLQLYQEKDDYRKGMSIIQSLLDSIENHHKHILKKSISMEKNLLAATMDQRIRTITAIGQDISSILNINELFQHIHEKLNDIIDASILNVARVENEEAEYIYQGRGTHALIPEKNWLLITNLLVKFCWNNRETLIIQDLENEIPVFSPEEYDPETIDHEKLPQSIILFPLIFQDHLLGILILQSFNQFAFSKEDITSIQMLTPLIAAAINNTCQTATLRQQSSKIQRLNQRDELTGVMNHQGFNKHLNTAWHWAQRLGAWISLIMLDVDNFAALNDQFGMEFGNSCLISITEIIDKHIHRTTDIIARYGSNLFVIFLGNTPFKNAMLLAERLRSEAETYSFKDQTTEANLTVSLGVIGACLNPQHSESVDSLLTKADEALFQAKQDGKNRVQGINLS